MEKETLQEAAEREFPLVDTEWCRTGVNYQENLQLLGHRKSFIAGANWQAERMYSEEDIKKAIKLAIYSERNKHKDDNKYINPLIENYIIEDINNK